MTGHFARIFIFCMAKKWCFKNLLHCNIRWAEIILFFVDQKLHEINRKGKNFKELFCKFFVKARFLNYLKNTQITLVVKLRKIFRRTRKILSCASGRRVFKLRSSFLLSNYCTSFWAVGNGGGRQRDFGWKRSVGKKVTRL